MTHFTVKQLHFATAKISQKKENNAFSFFYLMGLNSTDTDNSKRSIRLSFKRS